MCRGGFDMKKVDKDVQAEMLFQASGSMKLLKVWMERVARQTAKTWKDDLDLELSRLRSVVEDADHNIKQLMTLDIQTGSMVSFQEKMRELLDKIYTKDMDTIQRICQTIQNQLDYIVNDIDKKRKRLYEVE